jgi:hypothetical protein
MDSALAIFSKSINIGECRIINTPHLIFLCGGQTASSGEPHRSARDFFLRHLELRHRELSERISLAEKINDWFDENAFPDLLDVEEHIADLCDLIILFVESAGSIAELGAFAASATLCPKTIAVLNGKHLSSRSFISDGPIRRLRAMNVDSVRVFDWDMTSPHLPDSQEDLLDMGNKLVTLLLNEGKRHIAESRLNLESHGHCMLMIADLIDLLGVATTTDIINCFDIWRPRRPLTRSQCKKYILLLQRLNLVREKQYNSEVFYLPCRETPFVRHHFTPDAKLKDRSRTKQYFRSTYDKSSARAQVVRKALQERFRRSAI